MQNEWHVPVKQGSSVARLRAQESLLSDYNSVDPGSAKKLSGSFILGSEQASFSRLNAKASPSRLLPQLSSYLSMSREQLVRETISLYFNEPVTRSPMRKAE